MMSGDLILNSTAQFSKSTKVNLENCLRRSWNPEGPLSVTAFKKNGRYFWMRCMNILYFEEPYEAAGSLLRLNNGQ